VGDVAIGQRVTAYTMAPAAIRSGIGSRSAMRVLVLHSELGTLRGGGENFTRNLFVSFVARGHHVRAAFTANPMGNYPFPLPAGIEPLPIPGWESRSFGQATLSAIGRRLNGRQWLGDKWEYVQNGLGWRAAYWFNRQFQRRMLDRIVRATRDIDVLYVHSNPFLARDVAEIRPTVLRLPGPLTAEFLPVLRSVQAVCANGDALQQMRSFLGEHAIELQVGLDDRQFSPGSDSSRSLLGWTGDHKIIGYVGRLSRIKGVDILAEGFRQLSRIRTDARLLIVGTGEEDRNLRTILANEIDRGLVWLAGDVAHDRLPRWYRAMDVLVMPSRYENFSNALLEGLACGIPFVGSDVGGNRRLHDCGAGWLFELNSPSSLAHVLDRALADRGDITRRGQLGRAHVQGRYSWPATAERLEEIFGNLVQRR
jgi:glycosyltransferase involved in cell wall biosynthesis